MHQQFEPRPVQFERSSESCTGKKTERAVSKAANDFTDNTGNKIITDAVNLNSARKPTTKSEKGTKKEEKKNLKNV